MEEKKATSGSRKAKSFTRMYLGRVTKVSIEEPETGAVGKKGGAAKASKTLKVLSRADGNRLLWQQHELFQDAVNYYTLCLAGMLRSAPSTDIKEHSGIQALTDWRKQVEDCWSVVERLGKKWEGPQRRLTKLLGLSEDTSFEDAADQALANSGATKEQQFEAIQYLIEKCAGQSDLNQIVSDKLPWLATRTGELNAATDDQKQDQGAKMREQLLELSTNAAAMVDPGCFVTIRPETKLSGDAAIERLLKDFETIQSRYPQVAALKAEFEQTIQEHAQKVEAYPPGRKPTKLFPIAQVFAVFRHEKIREALLEEAQGLLKRTNDTPTKVTAAQDLLAAARVDDKPNFDYFTNLLASTDVPKDNRAVWFDFDKAAFIEAIKYPHRYLQDGIVRRKQLLRVEEQLAAFKGTGKEATASKEIDGETDPSIPGFQDDLRVELLKQVIDELAAEVPTEAIEGGEKQFAVSNRTIKGWWTLRKHWRKLANEHPVDSAAVLKEELKRALVTYQQENPINIGSSALFLKLSEPHYQPIWREAGREQYHADDVLDAWVKYGEVKEEKKKLERPIRFTPAHSRHSPRFFNVPKKKAKKDSPPKRVGVAEFPVFHPVNEGGRFGFTPARFVYSSPRLMRDVCDPEPGNWVQPMLRPLIESAGVRWSTSLDSSITLYAKGANQINFGFPLAVERSDREKPNSIKFRSFEGINYGVQWPINNGEVSWCDARSSFRVLSVDLGQRLAGAAARLVIHREASDKAGRLVANTGDRKGGGDWFARVERMLTLRLPGEDIRKVWRKPTKGEVRAGQRDAGFRPELFGSKGRSSKEWENQEAREILEQLCIDDGSILPTNWDQACSFPEVNDALIRAARQNAQKIQKLFRWASFLADTAPQTRGDQALSEIREATQFPDLRQIVLREDTFQQKRRELYGAIASRLPNACHVLKIALETIADRCMPIKGCRLRFEKQDGEKGYELRIVKQPSGKKRRNVGQRGLHMKRIEQLTNLRRSFMTLNRLLLREVGAEADLFKGEQLPEPCARLNAKIEKLKQQRCFQTAHLILREALGLELSTPMSNESEPRSPSYRKVREPVDLIVLENLTRYRASQGRGRWENSRLMQWCHRQINTKIKQLCELVSIPVVEVPAAYSSKFCASTGVIGFRAAELGCGFENEYRWEKILTGNDERATDLKQIKRMLEEHAAGDPRKKLLVPNEGGEIFVSISDKRVGARKPVIQQADINAAINIGLRAVAQSERFEVFPRLRTKTDTNGRRRLEVPRIWGAKGPVFQLSGESEQSEKINPRANLFLDLAGVAHWGKATFSEVESLKGHNFVLQAALFSAVRKKEWERVMELNELRCAEWGNRRSK